MASLGYFFGKRVLDYFTPISVVVAVLLVGAVAWWAVRRRRRRRAEAALQTAR
jgi:membrane protein DedA with SNARE-associated domain